MTAHDFLLTGSGSVYLLIPQTPAAREWRREHLPADALTLGPGVAVEWRYVEDIINGLQDDGLTVRWES